MKQLLILFIGILFFSTSLQAQEEEVDYIEDNGTVVYKKQEEQKPSLLYKITGENIGTSYIFGTIHAIGENDFNLPDEMAVLMQSCNTLYLEVDVTDKNLQAEMLKLAMLKDTTLDKLMSKEKYTTLKASFKKLTNMDLDQLKTFKPFILNSFLYPAMVDGKMIAYEKELAQMAQGMNKNVQGLETLSEQMAIMDKLSYDKQVASLQSFANDFETNKKMFEEMVALYKKQDINALYKYMTQNLAEYKELEQDLLANRNMNWIEQMSQLLQEPNFYAVGAGHLGGDTGVIQLLKERGYTVTPVHLEE